MKNKNHIKKRNVSKYNYFSTFIELFVKIPLSILFIFILIPAKIIKFIGNNIFFMYLYIKRILRKSPITYYLNEEGFIPTGDRVDIYCAMFGSYR